MTLLDQAGFADLLRVSDLRLTLMFSQNRSLTGGGTTIYADRAPALWHAEVTSPPMANAEAEGLIALLNGRSGGLQPLLIHNWRMPYPSSDPDGSIFGSATPVVGTITDRTHVAFTGFPADYVMPLGAYFGIVWDTSRYYLGQFLAAKTANGSGAVSSVEVAPPLPLGIDTGDAVTVLKPPFKAKVVPGSALIASTDIVNARLSATFEQTYEA